MPFGESAFNASLFYFSPYLQRMDYFVDSLSWEKAHIPGALRLHGGRGADNSSSYVSCNLIPLFLSLYTSKQHCFLSDDFFQFSRACGIPQIIFVFHKC
jgi:hypothetical protein